MSLPPELVLITTSLATSLHEIVSGSTTLAFKQGSNPADEGLAGSLRRSTTYVEARNGVGGLVMSLHGAGKGAVNIWSFAKVRLGLALLALVLTSSVGVCTSTLSTPDQVVMYRALPDRQLSGRRHRLGSTLSLGGECRHTTFINAV
jgi:hypothetical protein